MNIGSPFLSMNSSCEDTLRWINEQLLQSGLRPIQTFDLQTARLGLHDCACPHHGTEKCDCQLVVLLVYGDMVEPATLILHSNDGKTWVSTSDNPLQRADKKLMNRIRQALEKAPSSTSQPE